MLLWLALSLPVILAQGSKKVLQFTRQLDTCDERDKAVVEGTHRLIYAYNDAGPGNNDPNRIAYHGPNNRGARSLNLLQGRPNVQPPMESDAQPFIVRGPAPVHIPMDGRTDYYCTPMKLPQFRGGEQGEHVIRGEPYIVPENVDVVHHIIVYMCEGLTDEDLAWHGSCFGELPPNIVACRQNFFFVWAVGGNTYDYPREAGYPIGRPNSPTNVIMEIHYDNPTHRRIADNSGVRFWTTAQRRANDAGIFFVGHETRNFYTIPPRMEDYPWDAWCPSECTRRLFPSQGITVIGAMFHAHLAGKALHLYHDRDGIEQQPFLSDPHYDFNFQDTLPINKTLLPGDQLRLVCHYNTQDRTTDTVFGQQSHEEMCLVFLTFYPTTSNNMGCMAMNMTKVNASEAPVVRCANTRLGGPDEYVPRPPPKPCLRVVPDPARMIPKWNDTFDRTRYTRREVLDRNGKFTLHWTVEDKEIHFAAEVETSGWFGFGIGSAGNMPGADIALGWVDSANKQIFLHDRMADAEAPPTIDPLQDFYDIQGTDIIAEDSDESIVEVGLAGCVIVVVVGLALGLI